MPITIQEIWEYTTATKYHFLSFVRMYWLCAWTPRFFQTICQSKTETQSPESNIYRSQVAGLTKGASGNMKSIGTIKALMYCKLRLCLLSYPLCYNMTWHAHTLSIFIHVLVTQGGPCIFICLYVYELIQWNSLK